MFQLNFESGPVHYNSNALKCSNVQRNWEHEKELLDSLDLCSETEMNILYLVIFL